MKNISIFALLSALVLPAFATETPDTTVDNSALMPETAIVSVDNNSSFLHGVQFGLGISGSSGLNGFIGYANKDFDSFWAKRFGVRFDFGTTAPMKTQINEAINAYNFVIKSCPTNVDAYVNLAICYASNNDYKKAKNNNE